MLRSQSRERNGRASVDAPVESVEAAVYQVPTEQPEADGTLQWDSTTAVVVHVRAGGETGLGWSYTSGGAASVVEEKLASVVTGRDALDVPAVWHDMVKAVRNMGRPGIASAAIAAVDIALWDLKARLLELPLHALFGAARSAVPVYGSGGFVNLDDAALHAQLDEWLSAGCRSVKIKIGQDWGGDIPRDLRRVRTVREAVGAGVDVMVDANGGYTAGQASRVGAELDDMGVVWFEEPVSSDDLQTLALLREELRCDVAAGEYADGVHYTQRMCGAGAVDCMQVDVTRCAGYTEWLRCAAIVAGYGLQISGHCAPALHLPVAAAVPNLRHVEWFIDHMRLEPELFDGTPAVAAGLMQLGDAPGHGMELAGRAERYRTR
jgi:L-alanine-DL-glutamate epimerase-like enolase superfamily enzyme